VHVSLATAGRAWPAAYPAVVSVAGVAPGGALGARPAEGERTDLLAPGYQVMSVGPGGSGNFVGSDDAFAAAYVAGAAALVRSYRPGLSAVEVVRRLETTAAHPGGTLPHPAAGYGAVDPYAAVADIVADPRPPGLAAPLRIRHPSPAGSPGRTALRLTAALLAAVAALGAVALLVPRGRARGWRPDGVPAVRTVSTSEESEE
jgi:membrane-anchored mycosin MYCP